MLAILVTMQTRQTPKGLVLLGSHELGSWNHKAGNHIIFLFTDLLWFLTEQVCTVFKTF